MRLHHATNRELNLMKGVGKKRPQPSSSLDSDLKDILRSDESESSSPEPRRKQRRAVAAKGSAAKAQRRKSAKKAAKKDGKQKKRSTGAPAGGYAQAK